MVHLGLAGTDAGGGDRAHQLVFGGSRAPRGGFEGGIRGPGHLSDSGEEPRVKGIGRSGGKEISAAC